MHKSALLCMLLVALLLCGCDKRPTGNTSAAEPSISSEAESRASAIVSPPAELKVADTLNIYRFFGDGQIYESQEIAYTGEGNLLAVINHVTESLDVAKPLPILSITQQKGFVIINFDEVLLDRFDKGALYELLTTLVMTLRQNIISVETVQFQLNGEVGVFGEIYEPAPLAFAPGDPAEFAAICASLPYEGLQAELPYIPDALLELCNTTDAETQKIMLFLYALGQIEQDAASPAQLDQARLTMSCIWATGRYYSAPVNYYDGQERYRPALGPIADSVSAKLGMTEEMFWIADHVRQTARQLCGDDFVLKLTKENCAPWEYFEQEGVITPPHMGGGYSVLPVVLDYQPVEGGYRVEAVYIYNGMSGYSLWGGEDIPEAELADFIRNKAPRREIMLKHANDGSLRFVSHRFL